MNWLIKAPLLLSATIPEGFTTTVTNFTTAGQIIGGGIAVILLLIAAIQLMTGGRNAVEVSKTKIICLIIGMVLVAGCSVIKVFISGLIAF